jgi:hypothetical protein
MTKIWVAKRRKEACSEPVRAKEKARGSCSTAYLQYKIKPCEMWLLFLFPKRVLGDLTEANSHGTMRSELAENDARTS